MTTERLSPERRLALIVETETAIQLIGSGTSIVARRKADTDDRAVGLHVDERYVSPTRYNAN